MRTEQGRLIEALDAVEKFLTENREMLGEAIASAPLEHLSATRAAMVQHAATQEALGRARSERLATKRALREQLLRDHLKPIAAVASGLLPEIGKLPALRAPTARLSFSALVAAASGMAESAAGHEAALIAAGRPAGFLAGLVAATTALRDATSASRELVALRMEQTEKLRTNALTARRALRMLDVLVRTAIKGDTALLARWTHIRRVATRTSTLFTTPETAAGSTILAPATPPAGTTTTTSLTGSTEGDAAPPTRAAA